jgi:rhodanese-related sulfurtransferase
VKQVSTLDAFTRCWIQEHRIFSQAAGVLSGGKRDTARLLGEAWASRQLDVFEDSIEMLAGLAAAALADTEELSASSLLDKLKQLVRKGDRDRDFEGAQRAMYARLSERTKDTVNRLIARHGLSGETASQLATASREAFAVKRNVEESLMAAIGGMGAGLLGGLCADLAAGGMTFGGGALVGMLAGGATTFALAKGYNLTQTGTNRVRWSEAHFVDQVKSILLLYLGYALFLVPFDGPLGTFDRAITLPLQDFTHFPDHLDRLPADRQTPIVTFCTGGIRCEKAAPFMEREGFEHVWYRSLVV